MQIVRLSLLYISPNLFDGRYITKKALPAMTFLPLTVPLRRAVGRGVKLSALCARSSQSQQRRKESIPSFGYSANYSYLVIQIKSKPMKPKLLLTLSALLSVNMIAQQLPVDASVRIGQLDNGLTYYISHSENPKQCADFQLALPVGSILEEDHQNGIAHFVEHMAFRSTEHFPNGAIKSYCESLGLKFGEGLNAYTTQDSTWYFMSNIPTLRESTIDSVLLVLYDWSKGLKLLDNEIDIERKERYYDR
jgi:hypothetical protein